MIAIAQALYVEDFVWIHDNSSELSSSIEEIPSLREITLECCSVLLTSINDDSTIADYRDMKMLDVCSMFSLKLSE